MFEAMKGQVTVVDTDARLTYVGTLTEVGPAHVVLEDVAIYDGAEARVPVERFLVECVKIGLAPSRRQVSVSQARILSVSRLSDIIVPG